MASGGALEPLDLSLDQVVTLWFVKGHLRSVQSDLQDVALLRFQSQK